MANSLPEGYRVKYKHYRYVFRHDRQNHVLTALDPFMRRSPIHIEPCGGETRAVIYDEKNKVIGVGDAVCRTDENYVKRIGREIALHRALRACSREVQELVLAGS